MGKQVDEVLHGPRENEATEALEFSNSLAIKLGVESVNPCIALIWNEGVTSEANYYSYVLASHFRFIGKSRSEVESLLRDWNYDKPSRPLKDNEIMHVAKNAFKPKYVKPPGCTSMHVQAFCIGSQTCPLKNQKNRRGTKITIDEFVKKGWLKVLQHGQVVVYEALISLYIRKNRPTDYRLQFCYKEIENICNISRGYLTNCNVLYKLQEFGLLSDVNVSKKKGTATKLRITYPIPYPPNR